MINLKLNYSSLNEIVESLNNVKTKLDTAYTSLSTIQVMIENNNTGEAINSLIESCTNILNEMSAQQDNIDVSILTLEDYIQDTYDIISPTSMNATIELNYDQLENNIKIIRKALDEIDNCKEKLNRKPAWNNDKVLKINVSNDDEDDFKYNKGILENLADESVPALKKGVKTHLDKLDEIKATAYSLLTFDDEYSQRLRTMQEKGYDMSNVGAVTSEVITDTDIENQVNSLKRPDGMSDDDFETYKEEYRNQLISFQEEGWDTSAVLAYTKYIEENVSNITELGDAYAETRKVGSELFTVMYEGSSKLDVDKVNFVIDLMGGEMQDGYLVLTPTTSIGKPALSFDPEAHPDCKFFGIFADTVESAYMCNGAFQNVDGKYNMVHQYRYYIDKHNVEFIRANYKKEGMSDKEALIAYQEDYGVDKYKSGAITGLLGAFYHQRGQSINPNYGYNKKWMNGSKYSEFIIDVNGDFVTMWDTMGTKDDGTLYLTINGVDFDLTGENAISKKKDDKSFEQYVLDYNEDGVNITQDQYYEAVAEIANTGSFNYSGDYTYKLDYDDHEGLDVKRGEFDPPIRSEINDKEGKFATPKITVGVGDGRVE